jgi:hypothetical protein
MDHVMRAVTTSVAWLDAANGRDPQELTLRILKVSEEPGEAESSCCPSVRWLSTAVCRSADARHLEAYPAGVGEVIVHAAWRRRNWSGRARGELPVELPESQWCAGAGGESEPTVRGERACPDTRLPCVEGVQEPSGVWIPDLDHARRSTGHHGHHEAAIANVPDRVRVARQIPLDMNACAGGEVPQSDIPTATAGQIATAGQRETPVGAQRHRFDVCEASQNVRALAGVHVPDPHRAIRSAGHRPASVRTQP